jgi:hypothetical protein
VDFAAESRSWKPKALESLAADSTSDSSSFAVFVGEEIAKLSAAKLQFAVRYRRLQEALVPVKAAITPLDLFLSRRFVDSLTRDGNFSGSKRHNRQRFKVC